MNASGHRKVFVDDLLSFMEANPNYSQEELKKQISCVRSRFSMSSDDFRTALNDEINQVENEIIDLYGCAENDVEGAALAVLALDLTHPDPEDDEYIEEAIRIMDEHCPLLKLSNEPDFPDWLQLRADEMMEMIYDGAERMRAEFPSSI